MSNYLHVDILQEQSSKHKGKPTGDVIGIDRESGHTIIVIADGLGSGITANIAAQMTVSRILQLLRMDVSMRDTFQSLVKTMNNSWGKSTTFCAFIIAKILNNGEVTVLCYEMPAPVLVTPNHAYVLDENVYSSEKAILRESVCTLEAGEGLILMSDGISQAGMGRGLVEGWTCEGVAHFLSDELESKKLDFNNIALMVHRKARTLWRDAKGDDCSVIFAKCRRGITVNILTGPPQKQDNDENFVNCFLEAPGIHIVCGGSTAKITARVLQRTLNVEQENSDSFTPPKYTIQGINLVVEGVVTLNQVYNILDISTDQRKFDSPVFELADHLLVADKVVFWYGNAINKGFKNIEFKQLGILPRNTIIGVLEQKLKEKGKVVAIYEWIDSLGDFQIHKNNI